MKKALFFAGLAAASLALVGCNKEADIKGLGGRPVEIFLSDAQTRTVNDGLNTTWAAEDALAAFYAPAGNTEYSVAKFDITDPANNVATGEVTLTADAYDWYLFYPYDSHLVTPAATNKGFMTVGGKNQTQVGNDSKAHLAGPSLPIVGVTKNVASDASPSVSMKHVSSVVAVNITNDTDAPLTVSSITFTAPEDIVGTYYINFADIDNVTFTGSGASYVSNSVTLTVQGGTAIAPNNSAKFYIAIKPFTAAATSELKLTVVADQGEVEKTATLEQACTFAAGSIKTLNLGYEAPSVIPTMSIADINAEITSTDQTAPSEFTGKIAGAVVSYVNGNSAYIQDNTGGILYYKSGHGLQAGDVLNGVVTGVGYIRFGTKQLTSLSGLEKTSGTAPAPVTLTIGDLLADYDRYVSVRVKLAGVTVTDAITKSDRNGAIKDGADNTLNLYAQVTNTLEVPLGVYDMVGYPAYHNADKQLGLWTMDDIVASQAPFLAAEADATEVPATATSVVITLTGNVQWSAEVTQGEAELDNTDGDGDDVITMTFDANTDTENAKQYTVLISTDDPTLVASGDDKITINITQAKADPAGEKTVTVDFSAQGYSNQQAMPETLTIDGITFAFDKGTNSNGAKYFTTGTAIRLYGSNSMTVSADGKTLVSVELTFGSGDGTNTITTDVPTYAEPTWTGEAGAVTFTIGGTTGHRRIKAVTVKYKDGGTSGPVTPSLTVSPTTLSVEKGETATVEVTTNSDGAQSWSTSDATVATVANGVVTGVKAGTATITLSIAATENYKAATADVAVTVTETVTGGNTVSMTMTEYVEAHNCVVSAGTDITTYPLLQLSPSVRLSTTGTGNCGSFWVTSNTNSDKQWRLYQKQDGDATVTVANGCELVSVKFVFTTSNSGILLDASGNRVNSGTTVEASGSSVTFTVGNSGTGDTGQVRISSIEVVYTGDGTTFPDNPQPPTEITTTITLAGSKSVYIGETVELGATSNVEGATITYESEDPSIATVNASGVVTGVAEGTVKVYARIAAVAGEYTAAERYCNVTVSKKPEQSENSDLFIFSELGYANAADVTTVTGANVTLLFAKGEGSNAPKYYDNGTNVRMYNKNTLTISSAKTIKKVEFNCAASYGINDQTTFSTGTCTNNVWEGSAKSIEMLNGSSSQIRFLSIKVTYE